MDNNRSEKLIPVQQSGTKTDDVASASFENIIAAEKRFKEAKERLFNVNNWNNIAGKISATFKLTDESGNEIDSKPKRGDHFKIDLPGPGTIAGEGYDWVRIESVEERNDFNNVDEMVAIKVRPAENPLNKKGDVAHFFTDEATSSFIVSRTGTTVTAEVHGRNEKANTDAGAILDKTRNAVIASGAKAGLSSIQWSNLVNGLVGKKINS